MNNVHLPVYLYISGSMTGRKFLPVLFMLLLGCLAKAQNEPQFTQFMFQRMLNNPAVAGSENGFGVSGIARFQYVGLSNRISTTQALTGYSSVEDIHGGVGAALVNDVIGLQRTTSLNLAYAYQKRFSKFTMGVAASVGFINSNLDGANIVTPDGDYEGSINHNDPNLPIANSAAFSPDFAVGVYLSNKKFYASVSVNHLYTALNIKGVSKSVIFNFDRTLQLSGGYTLSLGRKVELQPSALLKTNFQHLQIDVAAMFTFVNIVHTGVAVRGYSPKSIDALPLFIGATIKGVKIVYSYDVNLSYLRNFNTGTHEIGVSYFFPYKPKDVKGFFYHNPRFL